MPTATPAVRRGSRSLVITIGIVIALALAAGAIWWAASRADSTSGAPAPRSDGLPAETAMGTNELKVRDLDTVHAFYETAVGLTVISEGEDDVLLGLGDEPLIRLERSDEPLPQPEEAGLYHTAILYPDQASLAEALVRVAQTAPELYQGAADHRVSEAFYFADPEGNGVELYVDRPSSEWVWKDGQVEMGSDPLDPNQFIQEHLGGEALGTAVVGHVHLKVGDLDSAREFYADTLGFDVVSEADGALFYSAGGYHHHLATNTWMSAGAGPRATEVGLGAVTITLPDRAGIDQVASRLDAAGTAYTPTDQGLDVDDPWGNTIRLVTQA